MTAFLLPNGKQNYETATGAPAVGWKLYTTDTGTANPRTTWLDSAQVTPNVNPVVFDARGEAVIFWSGTYRLRLEDNLGNTIWTVDGVSTTDSTTTLLADLATFNSGSKGAAMVGFSPTIAYTANSVGSFLNSIGARTTPEISAGVTPTIYVPSLHIDIERYGGVADGVTDNSAAFARAMSVLNSKAGGTLLLPGDGTYVCNSAPIVIPSTGVQIIGNGRWKTAIKWTGAAASVFQVSNTASAFSYLRFQDFAVLLNNFADVAFDFTSVGLSLLDNIRILGQKDVAFTASVGAALGGTLTAAITNGTYTFYFSNGEGRTVVVSGAGTTASWAADARGALSAGAITTAIVCYGTGIKISAATSSAYNNEIRGVDLQYCSNGAWILNQANEQHFWGGEFNSCTNGILVDSAGGVTDDVRIFGVRFENDQVGVNALDWKALAIIACRFERNSGGLKGLSYGPLGSAALYPIALIANSYNGFTTGNSQFNNAAAGTIKQLFENPNEFDGTTGTGASHLGRGTLFVGNGLGGSGNGTVQAEDSTGNASLILSGQGNGAVKSSSAFVPAIFTVPYSASMTPNAIAGNHFAITATNGVAFTINSPTNLAAAQIGQRLTFIIRNTSGGALGAVTWNAAYKISAWTQPATGFSRSIDFRYDGTNLIQISQTGVDVPN